MHNACLLSVSHSIGEGLNHGWGCIPYMPPATHGPLPHIAHYHTCPCHAPPATHTPCMHTPIMHAPLPCTLTAVYNFPAVHTHCHVCPMPCMPPSSTHPPCHALTSPYHACPTATHAPSLCYTRISPCHTCPYHAHPPSPCMPLPWTPPLWTDKHV